MIKNIIFDLGGVILNIDYQRTIDNFEKLGVKNFKEIYSQNTQNKIFKELEMGKINPDNFRKKFNSVFNVNISDKDFDKAWNSILLDFPPQRINLIKKISSNYNCFLLSNTNEIHYNIYQKSLKDEFNIDGLDELFQKTYFSHHTAIRKPDKMAFLMVLNENNILPEETLFVDDTYENILAARELGINCVYLDNKINNEISDFFTKSGIIINHNA